MPRNQQHHQDYSPSNIDSTQSGNARMRRKCGTSSSAAAAPPPPTTLVACVSVSISMQNSAFSILALMNIPFIFLQYPVGHVLSASTLRTSMRADAPNNTRPVLRSCQLRSVQWIWKRAIMACVMWLCLCVCVSASASRGSSSRNRAQRNG